MADYIKTKTDFMMFFELLRSSVKSYFGFIVENDSENNSVPIINFFREASDSNPKLKIFREISFIKNNDVENASLCILLKLFIIYITVKKLQDPIYRQMFKPDSLMKKYFRCELEETLTIQHEHYDGVIHDFTRKINISHVDRSYSDEVKYPGKIRLSFIRILIYFILQDDKKNINNDTTRMEYQLLKRYHEKLTKNKS